MFLQSYFDKISIYHKILNIYYKCIIYLFKLSIILLILNEKRPYKLCLEWLLMKALRSTYLLLRLIFRIYLLSEYKYKKKRLFSFLKTFTFEFC
jgi:hypothetical protein